MDSLILSVLAGENDEEKRHAGCFAFIAAPTTI
jgi:hypothetical protein